MAATRSVTIADDPQTGGTYSPSSITINQGDTITWSYPVGATQHTVTDRPNQGDTFDSGLLSSGGTFNHHFTKAGTFTYYCKVHGSASGPCNMCGTVIVKAASTPTPVVTKKPTPAP